MSIITDLQKLVRASGMSRGAVALESGVSIAVVSRLLSGARRDLTTSTAERIAAGIGYEIVFRPTGRGKRARHDKGKAAGEAR